MIALDVAKGVTHDTADSRVVILRDTKTAQRGLTFVSGWESACTLMRGMLASILEQEMSKHS